jgi:hypothetical protein
MALHEVTIPQSILGLSLKHHATDTTKEASRRPDKPTRLFAQKLHEPPKGRSGRHTDRSVFAHTARRASTRGFLTANAVKVSRRGRRVATPPH